MSDLGQSMVSMVNSHGQALVLVHQSSGGTYDPATATVSGATTKNYSFKGYMYNSSQGTEGSGGNVSSGARTCAIPATEIPVSPLAGDEITGQGDSVIITSVSTIWDKTVAIVYLCVVRE